MELGTVHVKKTLPQKYNSLVVLACLWKARVCCRHSRGRPGWSPVWRGRQRERKTAWWWWISHQNALEIFVADPDVFFIGSESWRFKANDKIRVLTSCSIKKTRIRHIERNSQTDVWSIPQLFVVAKKIVNKRRPHSRGKIHWRLVHCGGFCLKIGGKNSVHLPLISYRVLVPVLFNNFIINFLNYTVKIFIKITKAASSLH